MVALDIFKQNINRARDLFSAHRATFPTGKPPATWGADILRASLVFAVASLDAYMHDKIAETVPFMMKKRESNMPGGFVKVISEQVDYNQLLHILFKNKPLEHFRTAIKRYYSARTIQNPKEIERVVGILGISDFWYKLSQEVNRRPGRIKKCSKKTIKEFIQPYIERRHQIVHQADLFTSKKHNNKKRAIKVGFVKDGISRISIFANALDKVINQSIGI